MPDESKPEPQFALPHFTVKQLAEKWQLSDDAVREMFRNEPGVIVLGKRNSAGAKRKYATLRIPADVAEHVHRRHQQSGSVARRERRS